MLLALLTGACRDEGDHHRTLTFSQLRFDCTRSCVGTQIFRASEEYWAGWPSYTEMAVVFSYAGMTMYNANAYGSFDEVSRDPLWGIGDPACRGVDLELALEEWPWCDPPLPAYPPDDACFAGLTDR